MNIMTIKGLIIRLFFDRQVERSSTFSFWCKINVNYNVEGGTCSPGRDTWA